MVHRPGPQLGVTHVDTASSRALAEQCRKEIPDDREHRELTQAPHDHVGQARSASAGPRAGTPHPDAQRELRVRGTRHGRSQREAVRWRPRWEACSRWPVRLPTPSEAGSRTGHPLRVAPQHDVSFTWETQPEFGPLLAMDRMELERCKALVDHDDMHSGSLVVVATFADVLGVYRVLSLQPPDMG